MADTFFTGLILVALTAVAHCSSYCLTYSDNYLNSKYKYCKYGCCQYGTRSSCCSENVASIVGIVIGCLVAVVAVVVTIIVIFCCCRRRGSQTGQVVTSSGTGVTTMVTGVYPSGTTYPMQTAVVPGYGQPQQMAYTQNAYPQQPLQLGAPQMAPTDQTKYSQQPPAYESLN